MPSKKNLVKESKTKQRKKKKSPSIHESKSKSKSKSHSSNGSSGSTSSSEAVKSTVKSNKVKKPASNKSIGVGSRMKSLSSHRSAYKQSIGRTVANPKSIGSSGGGNESTSTDINSASMMYTQKYGKEIYDTIQLMLSCPTHKKVALTAVGEDNRLYLPFYPIKHGQTWTDAVSQFLHGKLLRENVAKLRSNPEASATISSSASFTSKPVLVELVRTQLPVYFDFVHRATFRLELTTSACKAKMCADNGVVGWYPLASLLADNQSVALFGPEPVLLERQFGGKAASRLENVRELTISELFSGCPLLEELREVKHSRFGGVNFSAKDEVLRVYGDFLQQVSPSQYMTFSSFSDYLKQSKLQISARVAALFGAFAARGKSYIAFEEFILGLLMVGRLSAEAPEAASASSGGNNGSGSGGTDAKGVSLRLATTPTYSPAALQAMADFIFRFYAFPSTDKLSAEQLQQASKDGLQVAGGGKNAPSATSMSKDKFTKRLVEHCLPIALNSSSTASGSGGRKRLKIFELVSDRSPMEQLHLRLAHPMIRRRDKSVDESKVIEAKMNTRLLCENCHAKKYTLSPYNVKLSLDGHLYEPMKNDEEDVSLMKKLRRIRTEHYFRADFSCNLAMDMIRAYAIKLNIFPVGNQFMKNAASEIPDWTQQSTRVEYLKKKLPMIFDQAKEILVAEPRVVKVTAPVYVLGDLHGNLLDLLTYEQAIWRDGIFSNPVNVMFLGDYVDRGDYSVEVVIYLICMKILAPEHVTLLRGNHESRDMHKEFTFCRELQLRFGRDGAETAFKMFNALFDVMPLAAVIDEQIFCCHGGIPSMTSSLEQIAALPNVLKDPGKIDLANEILWNDPITDREYEELLSHTPSLGSLHLPEGFLPNTKRNSGCLFSESALKRFLSLNGMSHFIRGHECVPTGFKYNAGGRCITVFSCSHYCQGINDAAIAYVHDSQIRVIQVDTGLGN